MRGKNLLGGVALALASVLTGCDRSGSSDPAQAGGGAASALEKQASAAAMAEIGKHWSKGSDGWTTALSEGSGMAPSYFLRQMRQLAVDHVEGNGLSDADRMNGFAWAGRVVIKESPAREAGESGIILGGMAGANIWRRPGQWSQWADYQAQPLQVQKVKGQWQVLPDNTLVSGKIPGPADYAKAGVK